MRRASVVMVAAAALAVAATLFLRRSTGSAANETPSITTAPRCHFAPGERAAFALESTVVPMGVTPAPPPDRFKAILSFQVVGEAPTGGWLLRAAFTSIELEQHITRVDQRVEGTLEAPFLLRIEPTCRFAEKGFPSDWKATTRRFVAGIIATFEVVLPDGADTPNLAWQVDQTDGLGSYAASYVATKLEKNAGYSLTKHKTAYHAEPSNDMIGLNLQIVGSQAVALLDGEGRWLRAAEGTERVRLSGKGKFFGDLEQHFSLTRNDVAFRTPEELATAAPIDWKPPVETARENHALDPSLKELGYDDAVARFAATYEKKKGGDAYGAALFLADWLKSRPEQAASLLSAIRTQRLSVQLHAAAFLALELCGTPEARALLAKAIGDKELTEMNRARAASALSDVREPTMESVRALTDGAHEGNQIVKGTSVRALGHLASRDQADDTMKREIHQTLEHDLGAATNSTQAVDAIDAIGNTHDKSFVPHLSDKLSDPSPAIREHAARALHTMPPEEAEKSLLAALRVETDPSVREALVSSLGALRVEDAEALKLANEQLANEPTTSVRVAFVRWLGSVVAAPLAKIALVAQFHREKVPAILQLIGRYVSVDDLR